MVQGPAEQWKADRGYTHIYSRRSFTTRFPRAGTVHPSHPHPCFLNIGPFTTSRILLSIPHRPTSHLHISHKPTLHLPVMPFTRRHGSSGSTASSGSPGAHGPSPLPPTIATRSNVLLEDPNEHEDTVAAPHAPSEAGVARSSSGEGGAPNASFIEISGELVDENPFDPAFGYEPWYLDELSAQHASAPATVPPSSPTTAAWQTFFRKFAQGANSQGGRPSPAPRGLVPSASVGGGGGPTAPGWRKSFRRSLVRSASMDATLPAIDEEESESGGAAGTLHGARHRSVVQEPGIVLSRTAPQKWGLVPLSEAQGRGDIMRRPEGFEMKEAGRQ
ncbi:hypothetical protein BDW22DRAFT_621355 [Trametopsis cervina]|nr:hypothetical protein BDW22DRAFT_621355 [Trametopsis cervina]